MLSTVSDFIDTSDDNFIGVFLYGSQNYGLGTDESDVDTIQIIRSAKKAKQEMELPNGKMKTYTLKHFLYRLKQGDMECYEILYTEHKITNPLYEEILNNFIREFSDCMNYDRVRLALFKKLNEHLCHVLWMIKNPDNARYNKKRLYWAMRVHNQLARINNGEDFESSLMYRADDGYDMLKIKSVTNYLSFKDFNYIFKNLNDYIHSLPRYSNAVTEEEERCISNFYMSMHL